MAYMSTSGREIFVDIVFPQNVGRLSYLLPPGLAASCHPGSVVEAPLRGKTKYGIAVKLHNSPPAMKTRKRVAEISAVVGEFAFDASHTELLSWVSRYYMCSEGLALKALLFSDVLRPVRRRREPARNRKTGDPPRLPDTAALYREVKSATADRGFSTVLFQAGGVMSEMSMIMNIVRHERRIIILVPEKYDILLFTPHLERHAGGRFCVLHGGMPRSTLADAYSGIHSGRYDVVIGTMQTLFVPFSPSMIVVFKEHSEFYEHEETPRYNVRDVAVKRGSIENIPVLLTSAAPSFESKYNCTKGKYILIKGHAEPSPPRVRILNSLGSPGLITSPLRRLMEASLDTDESVLLILNRRGHSILQCNDCGHVDLCPHCDVPLVFHSERILRCHYCNTAEKVPDLCRECRGSDMRSIGSGTGRALEILRNEFSVPVTLMDSDHSVSGHVGGGAGEIIIGTDFALRRVKPFSEFGVVAVLNADLALHVPDFRVHERLYQKLSYLSAFCSEGGTLCIQSRDWKNPLFAFFRKGDYEGLFSMEMEKRKAFTYPPFCRLAVVAVKSASYRDTDAQHGFRGIHVLGPAMKKRGRSEWMEFLLKAGPGISVQEAVERLAARISISKRDLKINIDPLVSA